MNATVRPESADAEPHFIISAFGVRVPVQISGNGASELATHLADAWAWCDPALTDGGSEHKEAPLVTAVLDDDETVVEQARAGGAIAGTTLTEVTGNLVPLVTMRALEAAAGELLMLHAAAVADLKTGATIVLAGVSGSGKSTAARALAQRFGYVSDETVAIDENLTILPYPKPVSLFPPGRNWGKEHFAPRDLGLQRSPEELRLAGVLLLERTEDGPQVPELVEIPISEAVVLMGQHTSYLSALERPMHRLAQVAAAGTGVHLVRYRSADTLAPIVADLMAAGRAVPLPTLAPPTTAAATAFPSSPSNEHPNQLRPAPWEDLFVGPGGDGVAFIEQRLVGLSPAAVEILAMVQTGTTSLDALTEALVDRFGTPGESDAHALTEGLVSTLARNGLLVEN